MSIIIKTIFDRNAMTIEQFIKNKMDNLKYQPFGDFETDQNYEMATICQTLKEIFDNGSIQKIGFMKNVEGGLTIDYTSENTPHRFIMGFTELGAWIEFHAPINTQELPF